MRVCLTVLMALVMAAPVLAQETSDAPAPSAPLEQPVVAEAEAPKKTEPAAEENSPPSEDAEAWELCPEPASALSQVPDQLDKLQADIDRYSLCLNRAELLMKLEDIKNQNKDKVASGEMGGAEAGQGMNLPMPPPLSDAETSQLLGTDGGLEASLGGNATSTGAVTPQEGYTVKEIRGVNGTLMARLVTPSGEVEQVKEGDTLEDGAKVTSVSSMQVMISRDGKTERLSWAN